MNLIRLLILLLVAIPAFGATTGGIAIPSLPSTNVANQMDLLILESRTVGTNSRTTKITATNFFDSATNFGFSKGASGGTAVSNANTSGTQLFTNSSIKRITSSDTSITITDNGLSVNLSTGTNSGITSATATNIVSGLSSNVHRLVTNNIASIGLNRNPILWMLDEEGDTDCDDYGNLAVTHGMMNQGLVKIIAMGSPAYSTNAIYALRAANHFYGRQSIPVGHSSNVLYRLGLQTYVQEVIRTNYANNFPAEIVDPVVENAVTVYRRALAAQTNNSVVWVIGGQSINVGDLWYSPADTNSALPGWQLMTNKLKELVVLGGNYPDGTNSTGVGTDYNFTTFPEAAVIYNVISNVPVTFINANTAAYKTPQTGQGFLSQPKQSPTRMAFEWVIKQALNGRELHEGREAWGQIAALWHLYGTNMGMLTVTGNNFVQITNGFNYWTNSPTGKFRYAYYTTANSNAIYKIVRNFEDAAGNGYGLGQPNGANIETDYRWIGRYHDGSDYRAFLSPYVFLQDYNTTYETNKIGYPLGASTNRVYNNTPGTNRGVFGVNYGQSLVGNVSSNSIILRYLYDSFNISGPDGLADLSLSNRFALNKGIPMDFYSAGSQMASLILGSGTGIGTGIADTDAAIRPGATNTLWLTDNQGVPVFGIGTNGKAMFRTESLHSAVRTTHGTTFGSGSFPNLQSSSTNLVLYGGFSLATLNGTGNELHVAASGLLSRTNITGGGLTNGFTGTETTNAITGLATRDGVDTGTNQTIVFLVGDSMTANWAINDVIPAAQNWSQYLPYFSGFSNKATYVNLSVSGISEVTVSNNWNTAYAPVINQYTNRNRVVVFALGHNGNVAGLTPTQQTNTFAGLYALARAAGAKAVAAPYTGSYYLNLPNKTNANIGIRLLYTNTLADYLIDFTVADNNLVETATPTHPSAFGGYLIASNANFNINLPASPISVPLSQTFSGGAMFLAPLGGAALSVKGSIIGTGLEIVPEWTNGFGKSYNTFIRSNAMQVVGNMTYRDGFEYSLDSGGNSVVVRGLGPTVATGAGAASFHHRIVGSTNTWGVANAGGTISLSVNGSSGDTLVTQLRGLVAAHSGSQFTNFSVFTGIYLEGAAPIVGRHINGSQEVAFGRDNGGSLIVGAPPGTFSVRADTNEVWFSAKNSGNPNWKFGQTALTFPDGSTQTTAGSTNFVTASFGSLNVTNTATVGTLSATNFDGSLLGTNGTVVHFWASSNGTNMVKTAVPSGGAASTNLTTLASGSATLGSLIVSNTIIGLGAMRITNSSGAALTLGGAGSALRIADQVATTQSWDVYANSSTFRIYDNLTNQNIFIGRYGTNYFAGNFRASGGVWATNVTASSTVTLLGNATNSSPSIMLTRNASTGAIEDSAVPSGGGSSYSPVVMALSGTNIVFSSTNALQTFTLTSNTVFTASGYAAGAQVSLFITGDSASTRTISFPGWTWLEGNLTSATSNKVYRVDITSLGTTATNCIAVYGGQQ